MAKSLSRDVTSEAADWSRHDFYVTSICSASASRNYVGYLGCFLMLTIVCHRICVPVDEAIIQDYIKELRNNKATDAFGLTAEHFKFSSPQLTTIIAKIISNIFEQGKLPSKFKLGTIVPVLKKDKSAKNSDSYSRIMIASNLGKIAEKDITCDNPVNNLMSQGCHRDITGDVRI